ncbi:hypothetical protein, partial [Helicobacter pylori]|uniref:hypothetical protein n=1 Tax=Helicobacter pylori TaxID=210 RepID=UPI001BB45DAF
NLEVKLFIADNTALFKSGNVGRCRDREMFFSLAFLSYFIIDCFCLFGGFYCLFKVFRDLCFIFHSKFLGILRK